MLRAAFPEFLGPSWARWRVLLRALFGLPLAEDERAFVREATGRDAPAEPVSEAWWICGRRSGKSRIAALIGVYLALFRTYTLAPGEIGVVMLLAADRPQAQVIFRYIEGLIDSVPALASAVVRRTAEAIEFSTGTAIEVHTSRYQKVRGRTLVACLADETAFWPTDGSANPDTEVLNAVRPALATTGGLLLCLTTPHGRRGEAWKAVQRPGDRFVVRLPSLVLNPSLDRRVVERAFADDPQAAAAEWSAEFRSDLETFLNRDVLDDATVPGRHELPPRAGVVYVGFYDAAGGSGEDSATLAIAHRDGDQGVLDLVRERRPPHSPEAVVREFADVLRAYRLTQVTGDKYAGDWPGEQFQKQGIRYAPAARSKAELYLELLAPLNSGRVELLDDARLLAQFAGLERRTRAGGRDTVDHAPGGRDDLCNAAAGALVAVAHAPQALQTHVLRMGRRDAGGLLDQARSRAPVGGSPRSFTSSFRRDF